MGLDVAGEIAEVGPGVTGWKKGDRVLVDPINRVEGGLIAWPDYGGNAMFNTLGNLHEHPPASLLVPDFDRGGALIVSGRAAIDWDPAAAAGHPGAERVVTLAVERVVEQAGVLPATFRLREYSPFNPR